MKKAFISASAYILAAFLGLSFYYMIFNLFQFNFVVGLSVVTFFALIAITLVTDRDFIQEMEEYPNA